VAKLSRNRRVSEARVVETVPFQVMCLNSLRVLPKTDGKFDTSVFVMLGRNESAQA